jgi:hypothetical protein
MIDMASVYAKRFERNPQMLQAAVMGQSPDPKLDPYTALNALRLLKESQRMAMAGQAQQPTSSPSIVAENMAPNPMQQGLGAMVPNAMGQAPRGMPTQMAQAPQAPAMQASGGLAGMPTTDEDYAEGGIVAFSKGGGAAVNLDEAAVQNAIQSDQQNAVNAAYGFEREPGESNSEDGNERDDYLSILDELEGGKGSPAGLAAANRLSLATARRIASRDLRDMTPEEEERAYGKAYERITKAAGPNPFTAMRADLAEQGKERAGNLELAKGEALLEAASAVLEGNNAIRGLAQGGAKFAKSYGAAQRADQNAKRSMAQMEFYIADSERKERMGNSRAAQASVELARKSRADYNRAELERDKALGRLASDMGRFNKSSARSGATGNAAIPAVDKQLAAARLALAEDPQNPKLLRQVKALEDTLSLAKTAQWNPEKAGSEEAKLTAKTDTDLDTQVNKKKIFDPDWQNASTSAQKDAAEKAIRDRIIANRQPPAKGKPSGEGVNKNSTTAPNISTITGAPAGATIGKQTAKGWEVLDSSGKLIGYAK